MTLRNLTRLMVIGLSLASMACAKYGKSTPQAKAQPTANLSATTTNDNSGSLADAKPALKVDPSEPTTDTKAQSAAAGNIVMTAGLTPVTKDAATSTASAPVGATAVAAATGPASAAASAPATADQTVPAPLADPAPATDTAAPAQAAPAQIAAPAVETPATPATPDVPAPVVPANKATEIANCPAPFSEKDPDWAPGLARAPLAAPMPIDKITPELLKLDQGFMYTDALMDSDTSTHDSLLDEVANRANALPENIKHSSRTVSRRIDGLLVGVDAKANGEVKVKFLYSDSKAKIDPEDILLSGSLDANPGHRADVNLTQTNVPKPTKKGTKPAFWSGVLTCADLEVGQITCHNAMIRLDLHNSKGIVASVFIAHRWGIAKLTVSDYDLHNYNSSKNEGYKNLGRLLSNTLSNECVQELATKLSQHTPASDCELQRLQQDCGGEHLQIPAAQSVGFRSWVTIYGRSFFNLVLSKEDYNAVADPDKIRTIYLAVQGYLQSKELKKGESHWKTSLYVNGPKYLDKKGYLLNNDGGGNVNFQVLFPNATKTASMRISASAILPTDNESKLIAASAKQQPPLLEKDTAAPGPDDPK
jgi:hypothetical protein